MTTQILSTWNTNVAEETTVTISEGWQRMQRIEKLDHLLDTISELQKLYDTILGEVNSGKG